MDFYVYQRISALHDRYLFAFNIDKTVINMPTILNHFSISPSYLWRSIVVNALPMEYLGYFIGSALAKVMVTNDCKVDIVNG